MTDRLGPVALVVPDRILLLDEAGTILDANPPATRFLGASVADVRRRPLTDFFDFPSEPLPEALRSWASSPTPHWVPLVQRCEGRGDRVRGAGARLEADPDPRIVLSCMPALQATRDFRELTAQVSRLNSEVQQRVAAERALRRSREQLREILEMVPHPTIAVDSSGRIILFSRAAEDVFGYAAEDMIGQRLERLLPEDVRGGHMEWMRGFGAAGEQMRGMSGGRIVHGRRADGTTFPMEASISAAQVDGDTVYTALVQDVSERVEREAILRQAQKLEGVGRLTGGVAHDFNNLLTVVRGNLDLLRSGDWSQEEQDELLGEATEAIERGSELTRQLLAFSRKQQLNPVRTPLDQPLEGMVAFLRRTLPETVPLHLKIVDRNPWFCSVDLAQLNVAVLNLVLNAQDAMGERGGPITIRLENRTVDSVPAQATPLAEAGHYVALEVEDQGSGIPESIRLQIFEPFFTTKPVGSGTGMGLSMVHGFVAQSGGFVSVDTRTGEGTTITLWLPRAKAN